MKVIHVFPYSAAMSGGHSNAIRSMIDCQRLAGVEAHGISPPGRECIEWDAPWILKCPDKSHDAIFPIVAEIAAGGPAVLHLHSIDPVATALAATAQRQGLAVAVTSHGQLNFRSIGHACKKAAWLALRSSPVRHADGIHLLTSREKNRLKFLIPWFRGDLDVIPHAVEPWTGGGDSKGNMERCGDHFRVLHLGRLDVFHKGLDLLLNGFAKSGLGHAKLVFAGPDWMGGRATLQAQAERLGLGDQVEFTGPVYGDEKYRLLESVDLFAATSRWEAFGLSLVEAMAQGTPALVSERINLAGDLRAAEAAYVVRCDAPAIADGLRYLAGDKQRLRDLGKRGRHWVDENTSRKAVGHGFSEFYRKLMR